MSAEEALFEVDNFLSRAIMAGLPSVTVIHGKGCLLYTSRCV